MTLQSSGAITMAQINAEFGRGNNLNSYRGTTWYTDAGGSGTFSSGAISMNEFYGKRLTAPISYVNPLGFSGGSYSEADQDAGNAGIYLRVKADGTWLIQASIQGLLASGNWMTPTQAGIGAGRYIFFTLNSTTGSSSGTSWTVTSPQWIELSQDRQVTVTASTITTSKNRVASYTVRIATDSAGSNIVSTSSITLGASAIYNGGG